MPKNKLNSNTNTYTYIAIAVFSIICMLLFAYNTSPIIQYFGNDSSMYLIMGKAMAQGKTLYTYLFDHKGPLIIFINMLPQLLINGTFGVWLIELFFAIVSSIILYRIADKHLHNSYSIIVPFIYMWITVSMFNGGNYSEEYSGLFTVISLYLFDKWLVNKKVTSGMAYVLGLCITIVFFMKPNNIAIISSVILFIGIDILFHNRKQIFNIFIFGCLGIMTILIPIIIYNLYKGTLYDMFYATILHNLSYCASNTQTIKLLPNGNSAQMICILLAILINIVAVCCCYSNSNTKPAKFIILAFIVTILSISLGNNQFIYYWTLIAPLTAYSVIYIIRPGKKTNKKYKPIIIIVIILLIIGLDSSFATGFINKKQMAINHKRYAREMYSFIPDDEKNDCFAYDMSAIFIYDVDFNTPCKYFTMQTWMSKTNPDIGKYCVDFVKKSKPKWLVSFSQECSSNIDLLYEVRQNYTEIYKNEFGYLYKRLAD